MRCCNGARKSKLAKNACTNASSYKSSATGMLAEAESDAKLRAKARKLRVSEEENSNLDENVGERCQSSQSHLTVPLWR